MKKIIATLAIMLCFVGAALAQDELSFERKQAIDSLALEKVRDLSKYIKSLLEQASFIFSGNQMITTVQPPSRDCIDNLCNISPLSRSYIIGC